MCSTPRSSPGGRVTKPRIKSFAEDFSAQERQRFAEVANRAEERRAQRQARQGISRPGKSVAVKSNGWFGWLENWITIN